MLLLFLAASCTSEIYLVVPEHFTKSPLKDMLRQEVLPQVKIISADAVPRMTKKPIASFLLTDDLLPDDERIIVLEPSFPRMKALEDARTLLLDRADGQDPMIVYTSLKSPRVDEIRAVTSERIVYLNTEQTVYDLLEMRIDKEGIILLNGAQAPLFAAGLIREMPELAGLVVPELLFAADGDFLRKEGINIDAAIVFNIAEALSFVHGETEGKKLSVSAHLAIYK